MPVIATCRYCRKCNVCKEIIYVIWIAVHVSSFITVLISKQGVKHDCLIKDQLWPERFKSPISKGFH